ncbi:hypothetical protein H257_11141 [Aphanomyces astaci]|uniref:Uncharacterized protein n=1 Tax=Aphanomyces astaci TaxID=112090 RepID=W4G3B8_APHAT|nr:hypothetical protein H257_11141 [Aphanomyces astaci]ETV74175.1 hypothetical protein H257_11141 [Aphanomyces astaci]|eukprot:XP_009836281.1 hypothetical protein H257_11141 [Aphanomyces astaci]
METCSVCGADDGPTLRQCNMCSSKFHHMCIVEEAAKKGWPEAKECQELCAVHAVPSSAPQDVPLSAKKRGRPKGAKNKAKVQDVQDESTPKKRGRPPKSSSSANMPSTPSEVDVKPIPVGISEFTPDHKSIRSETMFRNVSFRPLREMQIHKNYNRLLAFYADCQNFMLSGGENDPNIDTPGKNTKAEAKSMVAL